MTITFTCTCGKTLRVDDKLVGRRVKCPGCGAARTVEPPPPDSFDDFEVVEDEPEPAPAPPAAKAPVKKTAVKATAVEEAAPKPPPKPEAAPEPANIEKKKKKKKKKAETEGDDDWYEKAVENEKWMKRVVRGVAYIAAGVLILVGVAIIYFRYWEDVKETGGKTVLGIIIFAVFGVLAVGKGVIGLALGQFLGDDE